MPTEILVTADLDDINAAIAAAKLPSISLSAAMSVINDEGASAHTVLELTGLTSAPGQCYEVYLAGSQENAHPPLISVNGVVVAGTDSGNAEGLFRTKIVLQVQDDGDTLAYDSWLEGMQSSPTATPVFSEGGSTVSADVSDSFYTSSGVTLGTSITLAVTLNTESSGSPLLVNTAYIKQVA